MIYQRVMLKYLILTLYKLIHYVFCLDFNMNGHNEDFSGYFEFLILLHEKSAIFIYWVKFCFYHDNT